MNEPNRHTAAAPSVEWTPELLASIPDELLLSEAQRRRAHKRKSYTGGVYWKEHNPEQAGCRCRACMKRREKEQTARVAKKAAKAAAKEAK